MGYNLAIDGLLAAVPYSEEQTTWDNERARYLVKMQEVKPDFTEQQIRAEWVAARLQGFVRGVCDARACGQDS
jgi:hypothetical protein